jgi:hypothetical protein
VFCEAAVDQLAALRSPRQTRGGRVVSAGRQTLEQRQFPVGTVAKANAPSSGGLGVNSDMFARVPTERFVTWLSAFRHPD